jgi:hypothetical protein
LGYKNPALYPYEVIKYSLDSAIQRLKNYESGIKNSTSTENLTPKTYNLKPKLRPWLQDFDLGAVYNAEMVKKEIQAVSDALGENFSGWLLWSPENIYTF